MSSWCGDECHMNDTFRSGSLQLCHNHHQQIHFSPVGVKMKKLTIIAGLMATLIPALSATAGASTHSFYQPTVGGDRLSFCITNGDACGKPIADAWCRAVGFEEALNYQRDHAGTNRPTVTRYADTGGVCTGSDCESFRQIKCWRAS
jgi:hypothetical protein